ncbi:MAG: rod shape-determining protein MreC, partial [Butyricicoccus sp.]
LKAENEQLKQQISDNAQLVRDAQIALEENNQLRSQLGQPENTRTTTTVSAEVIARSPGDWADTLTLDKGSSSGVNKDDLVTTVDGMLGFVSEVTDNTCEVTSITDPKMQCGALVTRTRETAIAEGDYNLMTRGALRLSYLREDSKVVVGDTVETSGRRRIPKGILIGTVESVPEESGLSYYAVIKPFVSVDRFPRFPSSPNTRTQRSKPCRENIFPSRS